MLEFLFDILLELILPFLAEVLIDRLFGLGCQGTDGPSWENRLSNPRLAFLGYGLIGAVCGGLSLLLLPQHLIKNHAGQYANLIFTPVVIGLVFGWLGRHREARGKPKVLARFSYGFIFALVMALVRFEFAK